MKFHNTTVLTFAQKCKSILAANWQCKLNTITSDAKGSKGDIYTSTVKYILKEGKPYLWVPDKDLHNVNTVTDERGSISVANPYPGQLAMLLRSGQKLPARVALSGDVVRYEDDQSVMEALKEIIESEKKAVNESSYAVSAVLNSSDVFHTKNLKELLKGNTKYTIYNFNPSSCVFIDYDGSAQEVGLEDLRTSTTDPLAPFSAQIIDGINQSDARRRVLVLFCLIHLNARIKDAYMLSVDCKGFDVLGKASTPGFDGDGSEWKEYRISLADEAYDTESFCCQLVEMEEEALVKVSEFSGLG